MIKVPEGKQICIGGRTFRGGDKLPAGYVKHCPPDWFKSASQPAKPTVSKPAK